MINYCRPLELLTSQNRDKNIWYIIVTNLNRLFSLVCEKETIRNEKYILKHNITLGGNCYYQEERKTIYNEVSLTHISTVLFVKLIMQLKCLQKQEKNIHEK